MFLGLSSNNVFGIAAIIAIIILTIISIFYSKQFLKYRHHLVLEKRRYQLTTIIVVLILIDILFVSIPSILVLSKLYNPFWVEYIIVCTAPFTKTCIYYTLLLKFYLHFYCVNWCENHCQQDWKTIIDPTINLDENKWNKYRDTFGSMRFMMKLSIPILILLLIPSYLLSLMEYFNDPSILNSNLIVFNFALMITETLILIILYYNIPDFYDYFHIRNELRPTFIVSICYSLFWTGRYIWIYYVACDRKDYVQLANSMIIYDSFWSLMEVVLQSIIIFVLTKYPMKFIKPILNKEYRMDDCQGIVSEAINVDVKMHHTQTGDYVQAPSNKAFNSLDQVFINDESFQSFMVHLIKEFSIECLLSYVEFTQFIRFIFNKGNIDSKFIKDAYLIEFAPAVPKSLIVHGNHDGNDNTELSLRDIQIIGCKLYEKYCRIGSDLEINISSRLRSRFEIMFEQMYLNRTQASLGRTLTRKFSRRTSMEPAVLELHSNENGNSQKDNEIVSEQIYSIMNLFMEANDEIYRLLGYSFNRFKQENEFHRLVQHAPQITN